MEHYNYLTITNLFRHVIGIMKFTILTDILQQFTCKHKYQLDGCIA